GRMAGRHGYDPENLDVSIFGQPKLMFVTLYRMRRVSKFEIVSLSPWMTDVEQVDERGFGGPALAATGAVALAPAHVRHCYALFVPAMVAIEPVGRVAFGIAPEARPAEPQ